MKIQNGFTLWEMLITLISCFACVGWIWNVVKIVGSDFGQITGLLVMRVIGVFIVPLGAVLGYL